MMPTTKGYTGQYRDSGVGSLMFYNSRYYSPLLGRFISIDNIVPAPYIPQNLNRFSYTLNNPLKYNDPDGHCVPICSAVIGGAIGAIVGAVGYTGYTIATGQEFNTGHMLIAAGGGAVAGALIGSVAGIAAGVAVAETTVTTAGGLGAVNAACGGDLCGGEIQQACGGDCGDELNSAVQIGKTSIESVSTLQKIASQLQSKAELLDIKVSGDMGSLNNPQVQKGLERLNAISSSATSRIFSGSHHGTPIFEFIEDGIGVMRTQATGALHSVYARESLQALNDFVKQGQGQWLR